jgi:predicted nucleotidyltransferase
VRGETVSVRLRESRVTLEQLGVKSLALFGSSAREEARPDSDVDLLVEFSRPVGLFEFVRLKLALEEILECRVDLVTPDALGESIRTEVLQEAVDVTPCGGR